MVAEEAPKSNPVVAEAVRFRNRNCSPLDDTTTALADDASRKTVADDTHVGGIGKADDAEGVQQARSTEPAGPSGACTSPRETCLRVQTDKQRRAWNERTIQRPVERGKRTHARTHAHIHEPARQGREKESASDGKREGEKTRRQRGGLGRAREDKERIKTKEQTSREARLFSKQPR
ncbi:unnamed protein product [Ixodes pacificus]